MTVKGLEIIRIVIVLLILVIVLMCIGLGMLLISSHGCCSCSEWVYWDDENNCMVIDELYRNSLPEDIQVPRVVVFLTLRDASISGVGCDSHYMDSEVLEIQARNTNTIIEIVGEDLTLDSEPFPVGNQVEKKNFFALNPWTFEIVSFENEGKRLVCGHESEGEIFYITGLNSSEWSLKKGFSFLGLLIILFIFSHRKVVQIKRVSMKSQDEDS